MLIFLMGVILVGVGFVFALLSLWLDEWSMLFMRAGCFAVGALLLWASGALGALSLF